MCNDMRPDVAVLRAGLCQVLTTYRSALSDILDRRLVERNMVPYSYTLMTEHPQLAVLLTMNTPSQHPVQQNMTAP